MTSTILHVQEGKPTVTWGGEPPETIAEDLKTHYQAILSDQRMSWTEHHRFVRTLGSGGQGVVFLSERRGTDGFSLPVALKIFSPERYSDEAAYDAAMANMAVVSARIAQVQQDNLLDVHNWLERRRVRIMEMEWVDGFDIRRLLTQKMLDTVRCRVSDERWEQINEVIVTAGAVQPRFKPGIAVAIVRDCLAALAALHREDIVHGDVKPANIMLKRTGNAKMIDLGSAFLLNEPPTSRTCTPTYAAPEVLDTGECTPLSDLASLGYVLVEMLAGVPVFAGLHNYAELAEAKRAFPHQFADLLPKDVTCNELLMNFMRGLIAPDPTKRFPSAEAADVVHFGAAAFHRQLIKGNLAVEYETEIRHWLAELQDFD